MKLYVLDEPALAEQQAPAPRAPRGSRIAGVGSVAALLLVGGALVVAGIRIAGPDRSSDSTPELKLAAVTAAPALTTVTAPPSMPIAGQRLTLTPAPESRTINADSAPAEASSIIRKGGKYFVDLHGVDIGSALAMMSQATRTTVVGAEVLRDHPARLTAKLTASSPQSAWQSVFGNVANFAVSCVSEACVVHIVSAFSSGDRQTPAPLVGDATQGLSAPAMNEQTEVSMAAAVANLRQQQTTTYSEDY